MRNLFDQYKQPENRLTHALAVCLNEDRRLLRDFLAWVGAGRFPAGSRLVMQEQALPGDPAESDGAAEERGLPDLVVHDDDAWCVLVESKIQARLMDDQLQRHVRTLAQRGFPRAHVVALTRDAAPSRRGITVRTWSALYEWLGRHGRRGEWPERLREYLRAAEGRLVREKYLTEGTLTMFDGFPFHNTPYTYGEAKRLLKLATPLLRAHPRLRSLGIDARATGRAAITGRQGILVWDYLVLADRPRTDPFTRHPHLTLALHRDHLEAALTMPNGIAPELRRRLLALGTDGLVALNRLILKNGRRLQKRGATFAAYAIQRHFVGQRSRGTDDATMSFDLETTQRRPRRGVKPQPEWAGLLLSLLRSKRSNIQTGYWAIMPWRTRGLATRESIDLIADAWCALKPLLDVLRG